MRLEVIPANNPVPLTDHDRHELAVLTFAVQVRALAERLPPGTLDRFPVVGQVPKAADDILRALGRYEDDLED